MDGAATTPSGSADRPVRIVDVPLGDPLMREFVRFGWRLYRNDPYWVPQLDADLLGNRLLGMQGLLTPEHPYHRTAEATHLMAYRGTRAVGRVSVAVNHRFNKHYHRQFAFFGFFEAENDPEAVGALFDAARDWARAHGAQVIRGPGEYSNATHERQACLIDGFDQPVFVEHTYNPPYYRQLIEGYGFVKAMDYHAYILDIQDDVMPRLAEIAEKVRSRRDITTRSVDMSRLAEEVDLIVSIYNRAWANNWGFLPIVEWEADALLESLKPIIDPGLIRFAYLGDEPIAVLGCFPDPNWALRPRWKWYGDSDAVRLARLFATRRRIPRVRLMFFGIIPGHRRLGADALLYQELHEYARAHGYGPCDISLLLEHNDLILRAAESMGGHRYKTWRIWDLEL